LKINKIQLRQISIKIEGCGPSPLPPLPGKISLLPVTLAAFRQLCPWLEGPYAIDLEDGSYLKAKYQDQTQVGAWKTHLCGRLAKKVILPVSFVLGGITQVHDCHMKRVSITSRSVY
jgi:hypothetical protein